MSKGARSFLELKLCFYSGKCSQDWQCRNFRPRWCVLCTLFTLGVCSHFLDFHLNSWRGTCFLIVMTFRSSVVCLLVKFPLKEQWHVFFLSDVLRTKLIRSCRGAPNPLFMQWDYLQQHSWLHLFIYFRSRILCSVRHVTSVVCTKHLCHGYRIRVPDNHVSLMPYTWRQLKTIKSDLHIGNFFDLLIYKVGKFAPPNSKLHYRSSAF